MTFSVYRAIWSCLHLLYSAVQFLEYLWIVFRRKCEDFVCQESLRNEFEFISEHVKLFEKIPSHMVVILGNETLSFKDLTSISVWCIAAGISFLSIYDHKGLIKKNEAELLKAFSLYRNNFVNNITLGNKCSTNGLITGKKSKNGIGLQRKLHLNLFSLTDGRGGIVNVTRKICRLVDSGKLQISEITQELLAELIQSEIDIPDPSLAVYCGSACSTFGFLPWQMRVTEFAHLGTHHNISVVQFVSILTQYGQCQQRFGNNVSNYRKTPQNLSNMAENAKIDFKKLLLAANIKQEPGVPPQRQNRLPSFKGVRDLNLNSQTPIVPRPSLDVKSRKVFTPNLNVQRNKNKVDGVVGGQQLQGRQQQQQNRGRDGGRGKGRGRGRAVLIQSTGGVFSEGVSAESIAARRERSSHGKSDAAADYIPKPKLNLNHKIDKLEEEQKLCQLLKDNLVDDPTLEPDSANAPITLPNLHLAKVKEEVKKEEPENAEVLPGGVKIKKEKVDEKPIEKKYMDASVAHLLDDTKAKFVLLQLPHTLPGLRAEEAANSSTATQDPAPVSGDQACILRQLPEGQVGKLQVLRSGNVRLVLGKTVLNVFPGTEVSYKQVAMSVDLHEQSRGGDMINLGPIIDRLVCTPDWETLLDKCDI